jgi:hypothetical protein
VGIFHLRIRWKATQIHIILVGSVRAFDKSGLSFYRDGIGKIRGIASDRGSVFFQAMAPVVVPWNLQFWV